MDNDELLRKMDAIFAKLDALVTNTADMSVTLRLMERRITILEQKVEEHHRIIFGENGGSKSTGLAEDHRRLRSEYEEFKGEMTDFRRNFNRAFWALFVPILGGIGTMIVRVFFVR
ncbi:hypothetical protein D6833_04340 [Candidatus Parcubacteria bacterium]|nr:MAG: hypothetical protein D6833_04340 [Candidatus Parcubacteria bacterium]